MRSDARFNAADVDALTPRAMLLMCLGGKRIQLRTLHQGFSLLLFPNCRIKTIEGRLAYEYLEGNLFVGLIGYN